MKRLFLPIALLLSCASIYGMDNTLVPLDEMPPVTTTTPSNTEQRPNPATVFGDNLMLHKIINRYAIELKHADSPQELEKEAVEIIEGLHTLNAIDINIKGPNKLTALHLAAKSNSDKIVTALLKLGANPNLDDGDQYSPLEIAIRNQNNPAIIEALVSHKADVAPIFVNSYLSNELSLNQLHAIVKGLNTLKIASENKNEERNISSTAARLEKLAIAIAQEAIYQEEDEDSSGDEYKSDSE